MIRNIWAVGSNYPSHTKEMKAVQPAEPLIFQKAGSCLVPDKGEITLPFFSDEVHYEVEIAVQLDKHLQIEGFSIALDLTARDIQAKAKAEGLPWTMAKSFKCACPIAPFIPVAHSEELNDLTFQLKVNGAIRQKGNTKEMVFSPAFLLEYLKNRVPICPGDIILTGTPAGVSRAFPGDRLEAEIHGKLIAHWTVKTD